MLGVPAWAGGSVPVRLCGSPEGDWGASGAPAGVEGELPCCANAQAVDKISTNHRIKRKKSLPLGADLPEPRF
jgi:hypothetical protein